MSTQQARYNYRLFMKLIDRKPSLVIVMKDYNNFEYIISQGNSFADLKGTYQSLSANPHTVISGIESQVLPYYHHLQNSFAG